MNKAKLLEKITENPDILLGKPCIKGTRVSVELILEKLAEGETPSEIINDYPFLSLDDIKACLLYAKEKIAVKTNVA